MSRARDAKDAAAVFAALGEPTRLAIVAQLGDGIARTATQLAERRPVTRQAIAKHLRVMEDAGLVRHVREGREVLYALDVARVDDARVFLDGISAGWDRAIARLQRLVERE